MQLSQQYKRYILSTVYMQSKYERFTRSKCLPWTKILSEQQIYMLAKKTKAPAVGLYGRKLQSYMLHLLRHWAVFSDTWAWKTVILFNKRFRFRAALPWAIVETPKINNRH